MRGTYSSGTSAATSTRIISCSNASSGGGGSTQPPSRYAEITSSARARTAACDSGLMNPCTSLR